MRRPIVLIAASLAVAVVPMRTLQRGNQRRGTVLTLAITIAVACGLLFAASAQGSAQGQGCSLCVSFVSTFDPDGPGGEAPKTRTHADLLVNVPYAIDVDGNLSTLPIGILPIAPGYEMRVNVQALNAEKPRITIEKLLGAPLTLPLRIELVREDQDSVWTSLGYDTLASSAPQKFIADVDLSDRDAIPQTDQAFVDATITGPPSGAGKPLTLVTEVFGGDPAGARTGRKITRLEYVGDGSTTRIPGRVTADVTSPSDLAGAPDRRRVILTHEPETRTKLNFEISRPGTSTTGTVDELPARVDVTLADEDAKLDVDVDNDGNSDVEVDATKKTIDYVNAASVARNVVIDTRAGEDRTKVTVDDLPTDAHLTYTSAKSPADPTAPEDPNIAKAPTKLTYHANGRATRAQLESKSVSVVEGEQRVTAVVADVHRPPANITELSGSSHSGEAKLKYDSDARANELTIDASLRTGKAEKRTHAHIVDLPADISLSSSSEAGANHVDYTSPGGGAQRADFEFVDDTNVDVAGQTDRVLKINADSAPGGTPTVAPLLPDEIHVDALKSSGAFDFDYSASAPVESIVINGAHLQGLPKRINNLNVVLKRMPKALHFDTLTDDSVEKTTIIECYTGEKCPDDPPADCHFEDEGTLPDQCRGWPTTTTTTTKKRSDITISSPDGRLGSATVQLASTTTGAPDEEIRLPALVEDHPDHPLQDGVLIHDVPDPANPGGRYVIDARLTELEKAFVSQRSETLRATHHDKGGKPSSRFPWFDKEKMDLELVTGSSGHALAFIQRKARADGTVDEKKALLAKLPGGRLTAKMHKQDATAGYGFPDFQTLDWSSDGTVDGYTRVDGTRAPGFSLVDAGQVVEVDPMPTTLTVCKNDLDNSCTKPVFDRNLERLASGDNDHSDCGIVSNCIGGHHVPMDIDPQLANKGSVLLTADPKTHFFFQDGPDTVVDFYDLARFGLQAHKITPSCGTLDVDCPRGYVAMDTGGNKLSGVLKQGSDDELTRFAFPPIDGQGESQFNSDQYVWSFMKTGALQGYVADAGSIDCPDDTSIRAGGQIITERFCYHDLLDE